MRKCFLIPLLLWAATAVALPPIARHSPMHPTNTEMVTFLGEASGNIAKVRLSYRRSILTKTGESKVYTPNEDDTELKVCLANPPQAVVRCLFTMPRAFPAASRVTFTVQSWDANGKMEMEEYWFAAGDYPWPEEAIPIRVNSVNARAFSVAFIPDTDISVADFRAKLGDVVDLYFRYPDIFDHRQFHNFYYFAGQGHYEFVQEPGADPKCVFKDPKNMKLIESGVNLFAFLHLNAMLPIERNCAKGRRFASKIDDDKPLLHESGHAFFGLRDEYCCDSHYKPQPCAPNVYATLAACQQDAPSLGFKTTNCVQLTNGNDTVNIWRIDPDAGAGCIMGNAEHTATSIFQKACVRRILKRYADCAAGNCFPKQECP
jgi:hypothetical protein